MRPTCSHARMQGVESKNGWIEIVGVHTPLGPVWQFSGELLLASVGDAAASTPLLWQPCSLGVSLRPHTPSTLDRPPYPIVNPSTHAHTGRPGQMASQEQEPPPPVEAAEAQALDRVAAAQT